jgi:poly-beta-hydroxybutyrate-responsive repressor
MTPSARDEAQSWLPRNFIRPCLLLLIAEEPSHGYDLLLRLGPLDLGDADLGGMYRVLRTMERSGLIRSRWEPSNAGPPRRTYRLTRKGERSLAEWTAAMEKTREALDTVLARWTALRDSGLATAGR